MENSRTEHFNYDLVIQNVNYFLQLSQYLILYIIALVSSTITAVSPRDSVAAC